MEGDHHKVETVNGSIDNGTPASSRWNPTKEQISVLENLYMQGIRTPSAEQIQQITARLRAFGHIEGKNVFYWFQNHKARQRQKQKQENMAYFNRLIHMSQPLPDFPTPPCPYPNVLCAPCYLPHNDMGVCPPYSKVLLPSGVRRKPKVADKVYEKPRNSADGRHGYEHLHLQGEKTLPLFPLHPTGVLQGKEMGQVSNMNTATPTSTTSNAIALSSYEINQENASGHFAERNFIDFFSL